MSLVIHGHQPRGLGHSNTRVMITYGLAQDTDILVTHMSPRYHLDIAGFGDDHLLKESRRTRPSLDVFGHVHEGWAKDFLIYSQSEAWYDDICRGSRGSFALLKMLFRFTTFIWQPRGTIGTVLVERPRNSIGK